MPKLRFQHELPCSAEVAWKAVENPHHLGKVSMPVLKVMPEPGNPEKFAEGATIHARLALFGFIPWGRHSFTFAKFDSHQRVFETHEEGGPIQLWEHIFKVEDLGEGRCRCTDDIFFEAGAFNGFLWAYGQLLYRTRYRNWRLLLTPRPAQG